MTSRTRPNQVSVSFAPKVREELQQMELNGEILSIPDFVRRAVDEKLIEWRKTKVTGGGPTAEEFRVATGAEARSKLPRP